MTNADDKMEVVDEKAKEIVDAMHERLEQGKVSYKTHAQTPECLRLVC